ncbi:MAG: hypothetical protein GXP32_05055 [Kiritimatiellaeota bacterium]|nr:hypothetical protein [Kiritimatiellota bacterium]
MSTTISAVDARRTLGELLNKVKIANEEIIIKRAGKEVAKLVNCDYEANEVSRKGKLDFRNSAGLGKDLWADINADVYIKEERESWS